LVGTEPLLAGILVNWQRAVEPGSSSTASAGLGFDELVRELVDVLDRARRILAQPWAVCVWYHGVGKEVADGRQVSQDPGAGAASQHHGGRVGLGFSRCATYGGRQQARWHQRADSHEAGVLVTLTCGFSIKNTHVT
tara:strand:- start:5946 stop:6356 length:411 start_codon:yes stop_codon:yes gene_type:complete